MGKIVFIRHFEKKWDNNPKKNNKYYDGKYKFDSPILEKNDYAEIIWECVKKYGEPEIVYCSPYLRTRQTAAYLSEEFIHDSRLCEYLGHKNHFGQDLDLHPSTLELLDEIPLPGTESEKEFKKRVKKFYQELPKIEGTIYVITHGYVIYTISKQLNSPKNIKPGEFFIVENNIVIENN